MFDRDHNNVIDQKELHTVLSALGMNPTKEQIEAMLAEVDTVEHDGQIQYEEFERFMAKTYKGRDHEEDELREAFKVFDKDNNGFICKRELMDVITAVGDSPCTEEEAEQLLQEADINNDGKISYDEFVKKMQSM